MLPLSLAIISLNEEQNLQRLLPLFHGLATEIVVVDAHSSDGTASLCSSYGVRIYQEGWRGSVAAKQSALDKCTQPWILMLDCDEVPDATLLNAIERAVNGIPQAYSARRRTHYLGRELHYAWQPDHQFRLVHRSLNPWIDSSNGHDILRCDRGTTVLLDGWLLHYSYRSIEHHFQKTLHYARIGADDYYSRNTPFTYINLLVNPWVAFIKLYIIRRGFMDGFAGLLAGLSAWLHVFLKYAFLRELEQSKRHLSAD